MRASAFRGGAEGDGRELRITLRLLASVSHGAEGEGRSGPGAREAKGSRELALASGGTGEGAAVPARRWAW